VANPEVKVVFGASVDGLLQGVHEARVAIEELRKPVDDFVKDISKISEALGVAFAVEKIKEWITDAAEAGEHAVNLGAALNLSAEAANNLSGMMSIVGANADTAIRLFGQLSRAIDEALTNKGSRRAFAFKDLGIDPEHLRDVLNGPNGVVKAIEELGDAYDRLKASGGDTGVTGPLGVALGARQFAEIDKLISKGKSFREALKEVWESTAPPSGESLEALDHLAEQFHTLTSAVENFGKAITTALSGPLGAFADWAVKALASITKIIQLTPGGMGVSQPEEWSAPLPGDEHEKAVLEDIKQRESGGDYKSIGKPTKYGTAKGGYQILDETWRKWAGATGVDTSKYPTADTAPPETQDAVALHGLRTEGETPWKSSASRSKLPHAAEGDTPKAEGGTSKGAGGTRYEQFIKDKAAYEDLQESIKAGGAREVAEVEQQIAQAKARGATTEEEKKLNADLDAAKQRMYADQDAAAAAFKAKWGDATDGVLKNYKDHDAQKIQADTAFINESTRLNAQQVAQDIELQNTKIKNQNQDEAEQLKQTDKLMQLHQINATDAKQKDLEIVEAHRKAVADILQQELALAQAIPALRTRINAQIIANDLSAKQQQKDINDKFEDDFLKKSQEINQSIARDLTSGLMEVATGKGTILQAFAKLGEQLGQTMVQKMMEKFLDSSLFGAGGFGGLVSGLFGNLFGGAAGAAGGAAAGAGGIGAFLKGLPLIGGLFGGGGVSFATDAAGIMAFSRGGIIPSAAGGWVIPSFASGGILAQVHSNEMVLPADISQGMQSMIRGGGGGGTVNIHAWDTQTGAQALARNNQAVANSFRTGMASGGTSPRALSRGGGRYP
jgi:hypothetical protein